MFPSTGGLNWVYAPKRGFWRPKAALICGRTEVPLECSSSWAAVFQADTHAFATLPSHAS
eukprot:1136799-Pelagomonas_calceolata.AAC.2